MRFDAATGRSEPSITKAALDRATPGIADDPDVTISCHDDGPELLVWITKPATRTADDPRSIGVTLVGPELRPLYDRAPVATTTNAVLFGRRYGSRWSYVLLRTSR